MTAVQLNGRQHICTSHIDTALCTCSSSSVGVLGDALEKTSAKVHILYIFTIPFALLISYFSFTDFITFSPEYLFLF
jgi:hypothetical protein